MEEIMELYQAFQSLGFVADLIQIAVTVLSIVSMWKLFNKAGHGGWKILVPIYGTYVKYKIAACKGRYWVSFCLSCVSIILGIVAGMSALSASSNIDAAIGIICMLAAAAIVLIVAIIGMTVSFKMAKAFGQSGLFGLGLLLLPLVFNAVIAFNGNIVYRLPRQ